uniref:Uncharacterized protein n=1 Tax=Neogobius melanostomus TaxID=47308 RepID=A0A8C6V5W3_9GOBI
MALLYGSVTLRVTDSGWLLEPQEYTIPGDHSHLDVSGLITGIGYEVRLTGVSQSGLFSRPLTTVAATGICHRLFGVFGFNVIMVQLWCI